MTPDVVLVGVVGVLFATGTILLMERSLSRALLGVILFSNGVNLLLLLAGHPGGVPILGVTPAGEMADPLPEAMILTAIVITLGLTAFLLALAYRSWQLIGHDEVRDDPEDRRIVRRAERDQVSGPDDSTTEGPLAPDGIAGLDPEQVDPEPPPRRFDGPPTEPPQSPGGTAGPR